MTMTQNIVSNWQIEATKCLEWVHAFVKKANQAVRDEERRAMLSFAHQWSARYDWYNEKITAATRKIH